MTEHHESARPIEHVEGCPGGRIVRRQTTHRDLIICSACGAMVAVPRRNEWRDRD